MAEPNGFTGLGTAAAVCRSRLRMISHFVRKLRNSAFAPHLVKSALVISEPSVLLQTRVELGSRRGWTSLVPNAVDP